VPTVWLQERLKLPYPPWWEIAISTVYMSFFILPYVVAAVLWLRDREEWKAFVRLFVGLSLAALIIYALLTRRTAVGRSAVHPGRRHRRPVGPGVHVPFGTRRPRRRIARCDAEHQDGANGWVERMVGRGWGKLNLHSASALIDQGQASVNLVAAIPSLHAGLTAAVARSCDADSAEVAAAAGGLRPRDGVHPRVHGGALRRRHPPRLGAGGHCRAVINRYDRARAKSARATVFVQNPSASRVRTRSLAREVEGILHLLFSCRKTVI